MCCHTVLCLTVWNLLNLLIISMLFCAVVCFVGMFDEHMNTLLLCWISIDYDWFPLPCCSNLTMPRNLCETCWMLLLVYIMNITNVLISCMLLKSQSMVMLVNQISNLAAASKALSCHEKPYELWTLPLFVLLVE